MRELTIQDLPNYPDVAYTGELGIIWTGERWERNGQQLLGPISKLILEKQPVLGNWILAAVFVTGWSARRVFAFQMMLTGFSIALDQSSPDVKKGRMDGTLYRLLYKLARAKHRSTF